MLSHSKDTDREILFKLNFDKELLQMCSLNKYFSELCDEKFFRNRLTLKYPETLKNKSENMGWKLYYLKLVYLIGKMQEDFGFTFTSGDPELYYNFLTNKNITEQFLLASQYYLKDLLGHLINRENKIRNWGYVNYLRGGLFGAALGNHEDLVNWYLENARNAVHANTALTGAAKGGHNSLVRKLIEKGANDFDDAIWFAEEGGHKDTVELLHNFV